MNAAFRVHVEDGVWWADSAEYLEWVAVADSLDGLRLLAREGLRFCGATHVNDPFGQLHNTTSGGLVT